MPTKTCPLCKKKIVLPSRKSSLRVHLLSEHGSTQRNNEYRSRERPSTSERDVLLAFRCRWCECVFYDMALYREHLALCLHCPDAYPTLPQRSPRPQEPTRQELPSLERVADLDDFLDLLNDDLPTRREKPGIPLEWRNLETLFGNREVVPDGDTPQGATSAEIYDPEYYERCMSAYRFTSQNP